MKCLLSLTCSVWCSLSVRTTMQSVPGAEIPCLIYAQPDWTASDQDGGVLSSNSSCRLWAYAISIQAQSLRLMLDFNYSAIQAGRIVISILSNKNVGLCWCWLLELCPFFGRTKFIINFNKVHYKISTMVTFCPGGLLSVWSFVRWSYVRWSFVRTPQWVGLGLNVLVSR